MVSVVGLHNGFRGQEVTWLGATVYGRDQWIFIGGFSRQGERGSGQMVLDSRAWAGRGPGNYQGADTGEPLSIWGPGLGF